MNRWSPPPTVKHASSKLVCTVHADSFRSSRTTLCRLWERPGTPQIKLSAARIVEELCALLARLAHPRLKKRLYTYFRWPWHMDGLPDISVSCCVPTYQHLILSRAQRFGGRLFSFVHRKPGRCVRSAHPQEHALRERERERGRGSERGSERGQEGPCAHTCVSVPASEAADNKPRRQSASQYPVFHYPPQTRPPQAHSMTSSSVSCCSRECLP